MTNHSFGAIAGDETLGGTFALGDAVLLDTYTSVAVESLSDTEVPPFIALEMFGRINKSTDTLRANYVMSVMDAGALAGFLANAVARLGDPQAVSEWQAGFHLGLEGTAP